MSGETDGHEHRDAGGTLREMARRGKKINLTVAMLLFLLCLSFFFVLSALVPATDTDTIETQQQQAGGEGFKQQALEGTPGEAGRGTEFLSRPAPLMPVRIDKFPDSSKSAAYSAPPQPQEGGQADVETDGDGEGEEEDGKEIIQNLADQVAKLTQVASALEKRLDQQQNLLASREKGTGEKTEEAKQTETSPPPPPPPPAEPPPANAQDQAVSKVLQGTELHEFFSPVEKKEMEETMIRLEEIKGSGLGEKCLNWGGSGLLSNLREHAKDLCVAPNGVGSAPSSVRLHWSDARAASMKDFVYVSAHKVSLEQLQGEGKEDPVNLKLRADCGETPLNWEGVRKDLYAKGDNNNIHKMMNGVSSETPLKCDSHIDHTVILLEGPTDLWNWWWLWVSLHRQAIALIAAADESTGPAQVFFTNAMINSRWREIEAGKEPLGDFFEFALSASLHQAVHLKTQALPAGHRVCFRHLVFVPPGPSLMINRDHPESGKCFSSIIASLQMHVRARIGLPDRKKGKVPRVVYIARDSRDEMNWTSWQRQRLVKNEDEVIKKLKEECEKRGIPFEDLHFYGEGLRKSFREQAVLASRGDILIGLHGAGLNVFLFLPPQSVVCEISLKMTEVQKNSANTAGMVDGGYVKVSVSKNKEQRLDAQSVTNIWEKGLAVSIKRWFELAGRPPQDAQTLLA
uniref:Glycosyltransferase 61 catalytic domain-containing protein n=1 Tax=Chromera velia CCMP2878 TaxID=1169474 RepID=A0A0G4I2N5_9ALVE|eukprot:Cvel_10447.t1-p1 / transcript=Cvel_10447.t1 / gene=Cvel_10447 / organism=Chromera_velia_CCMP2878 / gene_product=hypothetical protein / transcript_product=hypothetical protein / location=Cvel_scaffold629:36812-39789(+) / protein_length=684 / sequence_SO=supercontig / SO=protein_coding / is_pseudo=false